MLWHACMLGRTVIPLRVTARQPRHRMPDKSLETARERLIDLPFVPLGHYPSPVDDWWRLRDVLGTKCPVIAAKRDDAIAFGFGGKASVNMFEMTKLVNKHLR